MKPQGFVVGDRILQSADTHADWIAVYGQAGRYRLMGASAVGGIHIKEGRPRDDAVAARSSDKWLAVAVADGVGSRPQSRYGASFVVEVLCEQLLKSARRPTPTTPGSHISVTAAEEPTTLSEPKIAERVIHAKSAPHKGLLNGFKLTSFFKKGAHDLDLEDERGAVAVVEAPDTEQELESEPMGAKDRPGRKFPAAPLFDLSRSASVAALGSEQEFGTITWSGARPKSEENSFEPVEAGLSESGIRTAFKTTRQGFQQYASDRGVPLRDYSCTLIGLLLDTETGAFGVAHIGDGLVAGSRAGGETLPLVEPVTPETGGSVYSFTARDWEDHFVVTVVDGGDADFTSFFLMTDGVADDCLYPPPDDILQRWSRDVLREMRACATPSQSSRRLLQWLATYQARGSWDDRTLIVVLREDSPTGIPDVPLPTTLPEAGGDEDAGKDTLPRDSGRLGDTRE